MATAAVMKTKAFQQLGIAVLFLATLVQNGSCQDTSCLSKLAPCLNYLNGTRDPPDSCCDPLKSVINSNPKCICSLISNKGTSQAEKAGVNINEAQQLPGRCGQHVNPIGCLQGSSMSRNSDQNSASVLLFPSQSVKVVAAFLMSIQILWVLNSN